MRLSLLALATYSLLSLGSSPFYVNAMTWQATWQNILQGGPTRWKVDDLGAKKQALAFISEFISKETPFKILCPLAGDDPFVQYAWSQGHDVTAIDLVPDAVDLMRQQFGGSNSDWTKEVSSPDSIVWKHKSGRATLYAGDVLQKRPELNGKFDAVYDKDAFGALALDLRKPYCQRLAEYCKPDAVVYTEVKNKESGRELGPPYHVEKEDLMETASFGSNFDHVQSLGEVYPLNMSGMKQTGHVLKRK